MHEHEPDPDAVAGDYLLHLCDIIWRREKKRMNTQLCVRKLFSVLTTALLLSACSSTVDWNYPRTPDQSPW